jgi:hypothetical protein
MILAMYRVPSGLRFFPAFGQAALCALHICISIDETLASALGL